MEPSPLICRANQWTGFYLITASGMKELNVLQISIFHTYCDVLNNRTTDVFIVNFEHILLIALVFPFYVGILTSSIQRFPIMILCKPLLIYANVNTSPYL